MKLEKMPWEANIPPADALSQPQASKYVLDFEL